MLSQRRPSAGPASATLGQQRACVGPPVPGFLFLDGALEIRTAGTKGGTRRGRGATLIRPSPHCPTIPLVCGFRIQTTANYWSGLIRLLASLSGHRRNPWPTYLLVGHLQRFVHAGHARIHRNKRDWGRTNYSIKSNTNLLLSSMIYRPTHQMLDNKRENILPNTKKDSLISLRIIWCS